MKTQVNLDETILNKIKQLPQYKEEGHYKISKIVKSLLHQVLSDIIQINDSKSLEFKINQLSNIELIKLMAYISELLKSRQEESDIYVREIAEHFIKSLVGDEDIANCDIVILARELNISVEKLTEIRNKIWTK